MVITSLRSIISPFVQVWAHVLGLVLTLKCVSYKTRSPPVPPVLPINVLIY